MAAKIKKSVVSNSVAAVFAGGIGVSVSVFKRSYSGCFRDMVF